MTARDRAWRAGGVALVAAACGIGLGDGFGTGSSCAILWGLVGFVLAIAGIVFIVQGKRIPVAWQAERRGHAYTAVAIRSGRRRRS